MQSARTRKQVKLMRGEEKPKNKTGHGSSGLQANLLVLCLGQVPVHLVQVCAGDIKVSLALCL